MKNKTLLSRTLSIISKIGIFSFILLSTLGFSKRSDTLFQNIYLYDTLMLASDINSGLKIYSVNDPANPEHLTTIRLDGNSGSAMKGNLIFANSWDGIYAFKLNKDLSYDTLSVIKKTYYECGVIDYEPMYHSSGFFGCASEDYGVTNTADVSSNGTGGSYALFAIRDTFLYYLDDYEVVTMSIADEDTLKELHRTYVDWQAETLFPSGKFLYLGGSRGMYILSLENPAAPAMIGSMEHFTAYDPVVVKDSTAYVTLRSNNRNVLLTVNVKDPVNPELIKEYSATTPYGLSVQDSLLYVSNGYNGFTLYNVSDPENVETLKTWSEAITKDFIWSDNLLYSMGFNSFSIYNVSNPLEPKLLSTIF